MRNRWMKRALWPYHQNHLLSFILIMHIINSISLLLITRISLWNTIPRFFHHSVRFVFRCLLTVTVNVDYRNQCKSTVIRIPVLIILSSTNSISPFAFFHGFVLHYLSLQNDSSLSTINSPWLLNDDIKGGVNSRFNSKRVTVTMINNTE